MADSGTKRDLYMFSFLISLIKINILMPVKGILKPVSHFIIHGYLAVYYF